MKKPIDTIIRERRAKFKTMRDKKRFREWLFYHQNHPHVYKLFVKFSKEAKDAGFEDFSARMIGERIRWYSLINHKERLKFTNNHLPYWARLLMLEDPKHFEGFFALRDDQFDADDIDFYENVLWAVND